MGADTGLHADKAGREVGKPGFELAAGELLVQNDGAALVEADEVEGVLADVDAEDGDGVFRLARHGLSSLLGEAPRSTPGYCGEHRRSIPLTDLTRLGTLRCNNCFRTVLSLLILWHPHRSGASHEAAGVHFACRWCGSRVATCRHRAGFAQAGARHRSIHGNVDRCRTLSEWLLARFARTWLRRGPGHRHRIPICGR